MQSPGWGALATVTLGRGGWGVIGAWVRVRVSPNPSCPRQGCRGGVGSWLSGWAGPMALPASACFRFRPGCDPFRLPLSLPARGGNEGCVFLERATNAED